MYKLRVTKRFIYCTLGKTCVQYPIERKNDIELAIRDKIDVFKYVKGGKKWNIQ